MRVTIFGLGTHGDVRPLIALGVALRQSGHEVRILAQQCFAKLVTESGLLLVPLSGDVRGIADVVASDVVEGRLRFVTGARHLMAETAGDWAAEGLAAVDGADLIVTGTGAMSLAASVAEVTGIRMVLGYMQPGGLIPQVPALNTPVLSELVSVVEPFAWWYFTGAAVNGLVRPQLGLEPFPWCGPAFRLRKRRTHTLFAFSPVLIRPRPGVPSFAKVTGFWTLDTEEIWQPPAELVDFLAAGPPPVYIGFGSMPDPRPDLTAELIVDGVRRTRHRAIIAAGWAGLRGELGGDRLMTVEEVPHDWLLPRTRAAVHHCGAGTTAAAARAGIPTVPVPFTPEQAMWGRQLRRAGASPRLIARPKLTADGLAQAIDETDTPDIRRNAAVLGELIGAENGPGVAIDALHSWDLLR
jgi:UDP:flavonoid glycosyltransferase YjiC (YdhE family)